MELPVKQVDFLQSFERIYLKTRQFLDLLFLHTVAACSMRLAIDQVFKFHGSK